MVDDAHSHDPEPRRPRGRRQPDDAWRPGRSRRRYGDARPLTVRSRWAMIREWIDGVRCVYMALSSLAFGAVIVIGIVQALFS